MKKILILCLVLVSSALVVNDAWAPKKSKSKKKKKETNPSKQKATTADNVIDDLGTLEKNLNLSKITSSNENLLNFVKQLNKKISLFPITTIFKNEDKRKIDAAKIEKEPFFFWVANVVWELYKNETKYNELVDKDEMKSDKIKKYKNLKKSWADAAKYLTTTVKVDTTIKNTDDYSFCYYLEKDAYENKLETIAATMLNDIGLTPEFQKSKIQLIEEIQKWARINDKSKDYEEQEPYLESIEKNKIHKKINLLKSANAPNINDKASNITLKNKEIPFLFWVVEQIWFQKVWPLKNSDSFKKSQKIPPPIFINFIELLDTSRQVFNNNCKC